MHVYRDSQRQGHMKAISQKLFAIILLLIFAVSIPGVGVNAISMNSRTAAPNPDYFDPHFSPASLSTGILDNFNRANGIMGSNWSGNTSGYAIASNQLDVGGTEDIYWNVASFGVTQEAFVTLVSIDPNATEIGLVLKAQSNSGINPGEIEVLYKPSGNYVQVWTYSNNSDGWKQRGTNIPVTFTPGDQFSAIANANGDVEAYRNGVSLGIRNVTAGPYYAK